MELNEKAWATELDRMIRGPVWPHIREWFTEVLVRRSMVSEDPLGAAAQCAADLKGAMALLLALENDLSNKLEAIDGRRYRGEANARRAGATGTNQAVNGQRRVSGSD
jgi:hypothetical protein